MDRVVSITAGLLRGRSAGDVLEFRGVPYATAERFARPSPVDPWDSIRDATEHGPVCPQPPQNFEGIIGPHHNDLETDEQCLNLTVTTPGPRGSRPVLVWIHGGSYLIGSGSLDFYAAHKLVAEGDVVVVSINYRLGVFGYLQLEGVSEGNLGLRDQISALQWVRDNIAAFGGDPGNVTVFGQSAGADSIACLMASPAARGLFQRAVLQSGPFGAKDSTPEYAARTAGYFLKALDGVDPASATTRQLLTAQATATVLSGKRDGLRAAMPFGPVVGDEVLPHDPRHPVPGEAAPDVEVMIGWTRDDVTPFVYRHPAVGMLRRIPRTGRGLDALTTHLNQRVFAGPAVRLADQLAAAGRRVYVYRFDWASPSSVFGACHCVDLPFLFGDRDTWARAPMLSDAPWEEIEELGMRLRRAVIGFARSGEPQVEDGWEPHDVGHQTGILWNTKQKIEAVASAAAASAAATVEEHLEDLDLTLGRRAVDVIV